MVQYALSVYQSIKQTQAKKNFLLFVQAPMYQALSTIIQTGCKAAIWLSERIQNSSYTCMRHCQCMSLWRGVALDNSQLRQKYDMICTFPRELHHSLTCQVTKELIFVKYLERGGKLIFEEVMIEVHCVKCELPKPIN